MTAKPRVQGLVCNFLYGVLMAIKYRDGSAALNLLAASKINYVSGRQGALDLLTMRQLSPTPHTPQCRPAADRRRKIPDKTRLVGHYTKPWQAGVAALVDTAGERTKKEQDHGCSKE